MKKKTGFEKFMSTEKTGAAKKEFFRQEKKKSPRSERNTSKRNVRRLPRPKAFLMNASKNPK